MDKRNELIKFAENYLGVLHKSKSTGGFDCSGFTRHCYDHVGIKIPASSKDQYGFGSRVEKEDALVGDIIVFTGTHSKNRNPGHVGMIHHFSQDTIYFIHVSTSQGVTINHTFQSYYKQRFLGIRRIDICTQTCKDFMFQTCKVSKTLQV